MTHRRDAEVHDRPHDPVGHRSVVWLLLVSLVLIQFGYPITDGGDRRTGLYLLF